MILELPTAFGWAITSVSPSALTGLLAKHRQASDNASGRNVICLSYLLG